MEGRTRSRETGLARFRVGDWVRVAGSRRRARIASFYAEEEGAAILDRTVLGFRSWHSSELRKIDPPEPPVVFNLRRPGRVASGRRILYIGRPSRWGNPFQNGTREENIRRFEAFLRRNDKLLAKLEDLSGYALGCYCKPKPCHGDVIVKVWKERFGKGERC